MLRKIFSAFVLALTLTILNVGSAFAATVAVVIDTPAGIFSAPEIVNANLYATLDKIFDGTTNFDFLSHDETNAYVQIYREENDLVTSLNNETGFVTLKPFKQEDYAGLCNYLGADYLIFTNVTGSAPTFAGGFLNAARSINVIIDFRIWRSDKNNFVYVRRLATTGMSKTVIGGGSGSSIRALDKALKKGLQQIENDAPAIKAAMNG